MRGGREGRPPRRLPPEGVLVMQTPCGGVSERLGIGTSKSAEKIRNQSAADNPGRRMLDIMIPALIIGSQRGPICRHRALKQVQIAEDAKQGQRVPFAGVRGVCPL